MRPRDDLPRRCSRGSTRILPRQQAAYRAHGGRQFSGGVSRKPAEAVPVAQRMGTAIGRQHGIPSLVKPLERFVIQCPMM
jgi:hypothetical protein